MDVRREKRGQADPGALANLAAEAASVGPWFTTGESARTVKSAERTLALFELFSLRQQPMTVGEIARALQIPQPSVSMLLRNLTQLGYLEHDRAARTYVPSIRIVLLGTWIQRHFSQKGNLEQRLDGLMSRIEATLNIRATVLLGIQNGIHSQYVLVQMPQNPDLLVQSGMLRPITRTAIGRMLLSQKSDTDVEAIVRRCNAEAPDDRLRVRPAEFMDMIRQTRRDGYATTLGDMTPGRGAIAVLVPSPIAFTPMAVAVGGLETSLSDHRDDILAALREFQAGQSAAVSEG